MIMLPAVFGTTGAHLLELLGHELAECLWAVLVIAARSGVDLGAEFDACMELLGGIEWYYRGLRSERVLVGMGREPDGAVSDGPDLTFWSQVQRVAAQRVPTIVP